METRKVAVLEGDFCLTTLLQPFTLTAMNVSIYDTLPQIQTFTPATDSYGSTISDLNFCGPKIFVANDPKVVVSPPASGATNTDPWTISCVTNDITLVGVYIVTVTASLANYPLVAPVTSTFVLTIIDECQVAVLDNLS